MASMELKMKLHRKLLLICLSSTFISAPLWGATPTSDTLNQQVDQLQRQMRAVQRKIFPDGKNHEIVSPEITAPVATEAAPNQPDTSLLTVLSARVDSLEQSMTQLTAQTEENGHRLRQMEQQFENFKTEMQSRLTAPAEAGVTGDTDPVNMPPQSSNNGQSNTVQNNMTKPNNASNIKNNTPLVSKSDDVKGIATVAPVTKATSDKNQADNTVKSSVNKMTDTKKTVTSSPAPIGPATKTTADKSVTALIAENADSNSDPAEQAYLAGYKLWMDKRYPEAETVLKSVITKYPDHHRASYARNLMGRAYLDSGQPAQAAEIFYANYQTLPQGARAPDSLYFLGQSLMALKPPRPKDACKVYAELLDVYSDKLGDSLKDRITKGQDQAKCR
ncbi:MAG: tetratricopeptide repeat protein [Zymomonas mobilis subsp. pomaceae]|uniref:Tetratricopeptide repeat protein n=1 Tax=Zymomonas mobilis subsp. pomaceae (strain ATCC 29192 / DSM 22645 / JCM 10191 / CCUG 17912 / NBRC 13757 / NCIMB 11200 / NRRL B-4491 / Barker I) TaxID=579138 RepID=F8EVL1_ZYMMT|nr:tetratricopeptide repeat protein [Zymomonas mobilis]AEI38348.1 conserved hypothetical protein-like protein [Zymomonas mobilis subsp. pomaceae ATCC 29192]MDX5948037.1 tetratricopeptide repeat protein [Zymomonas mobilis subsp. pomaceae]GEB89367.1 hypothetical protein ZMO02_10040 [Zymomonas mobilis subsp. pomaceae]